MYLVQYRTVLSASIVEAQIEASSVSEAACFFVRDFPAAIVVGYPSAL